MGQEIVYCDRCGERIVESEFEKGHAVVLLGKRYCRKCLAYAVEKGRGAGREPEGKGGDAPPSPEPAARKAAASGKRPTSGQTRRVPKATTARFPARRPRLKGPLILAVVLVGVALLVLLLFLALGRR